MDAVNPTRLRMVREHAVFETLQGEGILAGMPSMFVRTAGCDLRCAPSVQDPLVGAVGWACDTPLSLPDYDHRRKQFTVVPTKHGEDTDVGALADRIIAAAPEYLVITGGEPTLQADALSYLLAVLETKLPDLHITIETNGRHFHEGLARRLDLVSLSPKVYQPESVDMDALVSWIISDKLTPRGNDLQVKIVLCDAIDVEAIGCALTIFKTARQYRPGAILYVQQAHGTIDEDSGSNLIPWVAQDPELRALGVRYSQQNHKQWGVL